MRVVVDKERCVAAGQCVLSAPEVFDQSEDDGLVILLDESPEGLDDAVRMAAQLCPSQAIAIVDD